MYGIFVLYFSIFINMKKLILLSLAAIISASCSMLINTSSYEKVNTYKPVAAVFADLNISPEKITYFNMPSKTVVKAGMQNVVNTAVREALIANGNADVLVGLETQIKYNKRGKIESITVTGYPARYVNFRNVGDEHLKALMLNPAANASKGILKRFRK